MIQVRPYPTKTESRLGHAKGHAHFTSTFRYINAPICTHFKFQKLFKKFSRLKFVPGLRCLREREKIWSRLWIKQRQRHLLKKRKVLSASLILVLQQRVRL